MPVDDDASGNQSEKPGTKSNGTADKTAGVTPKPEDIQMTDKYEKQFKMLGFTSSSKVPRAHFISGVDVILP